VYTRSIWESDVRKRWEVVVVRAIMTGIERRLGRRSGKWGGGGGFVHECGGC
jgi:hypothetical protein